MSESVIMNGKRIIDGLKAAVAYAKGDKTKGQVVNVEHDLLMTGADLLYDCGYQFRRYERMHAQKGTAEGLMKAKANAEWAEKCENFCKQVNQWTSSSLKL